MYGRDPLSQPESKALFDLIRRADPQLVIACHAFRGRQFVNFDGPAQDLAARFSQQSGLPADSSNELGFATPGSLGSYLGVDLGVPVLTIEWLRGSDSAADWRQSRQAILSVIATG